MSISKECRIYHELKEEKVCVETENIQNTHDTRAGFMLQLAYFRANARFFPIESFKKRDIEYIQSILKSSNIDLSKYNSTIISRHRRKILTMLSWQDYDKAAKELLVSYAHRQATNQQKPKQIFISLIDLCWIRVSI